MYKTVKVFWGIFVAAAVLAGAAPFVWAGKDTVIPGVRLNGTAVGGMGKVRLEEFFREKNEELAAKKLALNHGAVHEAGQMSFCGWGKREICFLTGSPAGKQSFMVM